MGAVALQPRSLSCAALVAYGPTGEVDLRHDGAPPEAVRARIDSLTAHLLALPEYHVEMRVEHTVEDGMYMRKLFIPKDTILVGKIHLKSCINIVASGSITVLTEFGMRRVNAGFTGVSAQGIQKVGIAHEDTVFINVFRTDLTDIAAIEAEIAAEEHVGNAPSDYDLFLVENSLTDAEVKAIVADMSDHVAMPPDFDGIVERASNIEGAGVFALREFEEGQFIAPARIGGARTFVGRRTNHSASPNCRFTPAGHDLLLLALRGIEAGEELTVNYRQAAAANRAATQEQACQ